MGKGNSSSSGINGVVSISSRLPSCDGGKRSVFYINHLSYIR